MADSRKFKIVICTKKYLVHVPFRIRLFELRWCRSCCSRVSRRIPNQVNHNESCALLDTAHLMAQRMVLITDLMLPEAVAVELLEPILVVPRTQHTLTQTGVPNLKDINLQEQINMLVILHKINHLIVIRFFYVKNFFILLYQCYQICFYFFD